MSRKESDSEPALDDLSSHDIEQLADTWFFQVLVCLDNGGDFSEVLNARKQQLERSHSTVSVILWAACPDSGSENLGAQLYEGFVHYGSSNQIRMGTLKHVLPEKVVSDEVEIIQATLEEIHPGRGNQYTKHPIIKKYLEETTLDPLAYSNKKRLRKDFRGSSAIIFHDIVWALDNKLLRCSAS